MPCFLLLPSGHAFFIRQINTGSGFQAQNIFSGLGVSKAPRGHIGILINHLHRKNSALEK